MPQLTMYRIFISHAWKYGEDYNHLVSLLDDASNFSYANYSAPKDKPLELDDPLATDQEIKDAIDCKIRPVNIVIILGGMYAKRKWMKYEKESAERMGKPIIVVRPWGQERIPDELSDYPLIGWNTSTIVDAIRTYSE